jgi:dipeptide/tripeptide permease
MYRPLALEWQLELFWCVYEFSHWTGLEDRSELASQSCIISLVPGLQFLEVTAFYGVYLSLIVYLQDVLRGDSASNVATVNSWAGVSYLMPLLGAAVADSYWGKYKTVLIGLSISIVVSEHRPASCFIYTLLL